MRKDKVSFCACSQRRGKGKATFVDTVNQDVVAGKIVWQTN